MNYIELSIEVTPIEPGRDILIAELAEIGFESFVEFELGVNAYIQESLFNEDEMKQLFSFNSSEFKVSYHQNRIEDQNWNEVWEKNFEPINVNQQCYIRAPFHEKKSNIEYDIVIEPKMSFGTGHHETTYLMIEELLKMEVKSKKILDMGCGTGVLAILTEKLGASEIVAIDIDEWAYENTVENIKTNNCSKIKPLLGGAECIAPHKFDIVIANINRNILTKDMDKYADSLCSNGHLLLSGFFDSDTELLINHAEKLQLKIKSKSIKNEWTLLHLIR
ncbi:MAG: 50S ribosomal protein L11 methyltransferase [Flavobacteriales bacterium]|nr:50S ribosomal protein L11 methyltransferase [Flavobacteriales bacterium]